MRISDLRFRVMRNTAERYSEYEHAIVHVWNKSDYHPEEYLGVTDGALWIRWQGTVAERGADNYWYACQIGDGGFSNLEEFAISQKIARKAIPMADRFYHRTQPEEVVERLLKYGATYVVEDKRNHRMVRPGTDDVYPDGWGWFYALCYGDGSNSQGHVMAQPENALEAVQARVQDALNNNGRGWGITSEWYERWEGQGFPIQGGRKLSAPDQRHPLDILS